MPVWHDVTRELRESGALTVIGITQEQHPDRCRLFAQWQGFEWPILWDPFNLTGMTVVPVTMAIDEHGIVRASRLNPQKVQEQLIGGFLEPLFEPPASMPAQELAVQRAWLEREDVPEEGRALARLMWRGDEGIDQAIEVLERAAEESSDPAAAFRLGVAYRLRYDSAHTRPTDFQASIDQWTAALRADPNQYIWRRRVQQYGPRLDKPYPFYDWIDKAREEVAARGETPVDVLVPLTGSEVAAPSNVLPRRAGAEEAPDPAREIDLDEAGLIAIEGAAAVHTGSAGPRVRARPTARIHLALRPDAGRDVHWTNDAGKALVWVAVPHGWTIEHNLHALNAPPEATSSEVRRLDFEVVPPEVVQGPASVIGYALYYVCEGASGECLYRRQDFRVEIPLPPARGGPGGHR